MKMSKEEMEMTAAADLHSATRVGAERTKRPVFVDLLPPCNQACPAGENIQAWLAFIQAGQYRRAWETIMEDNPMPAVHGRVCYHPCEAPCNRSQLDEPVSIHAVERFIGDLAIRNGWPAKVPSTCDGKRVLIVGAGPSGLSAAYHLRRLGHSATILEAGPIAGGMMHFGIPKYRLPRNILEAEVARIAQAGIEIVVKHKVTDVLAEKRNGDFDAVYIAVGAHIGRRTEIPALHAGKIMDALHFLEDVERGAPPQLGRRVAVYGGGNTAMDVARTAKRLGAGDALIIYRRDMTHMPAHAFEAEEALDEGIKIHWLRTITQINATTFTVEIMELDGDGRPRPTGKFETLEADSLILATGQNVDTEFLKRTPGLEFGDDGTVVVDDHLMTGYPGLFAGGDAVPSQRSVTIAVGHGKKAARCIHAWLRGQPYKRPKKHAAATFDKLNIWYYTDAVRRSDAKIDIARRQSTFAEVVGGLDETAAIFEARRCLSCGNCFECDGCYGACPENAVIKLGEGERYRFDYDRCTGCAVCFDQCPCGAIKMVPEVK